MPTTIRPSLDAVLNTYPDQKAGKVRIQFIDGLRGLAALYVLAYHASIAIYVPGLFGGAKITGSFLDKILDFLLLFLESFQHYAVVLFIVISGYSLMLSVVRSKEGRLSGGIFSFFKRRGIRLLPTYFAALILSIGVIFLFSEKSPSVENIVTHIFLVQNWFSTSIYTIDGPMWSLAVEWQIYLLFPILLIPVWKWLGSLAVVIVGLLMGLVIQFSFDNSQTTIFAWFIGLFALGMFAASIGFPRSHSEDYLKRKIPWGVLAIFFIFCWFGIRLLTKSNDFQRDISWYKDTLMGLAFCCLLLHLTKIQTNFSSASKPNILSRLFSSKWLVFLGSFSYSIYLFHAPILSLLEFIFRSLALPQFLSGALVLLLGVPFALGLSYPLYLAFEKPFVRLLAGPKPNLPLQPQNFRKAEPLHKVPNLNDHIPHL